MFQPLSGIYLMHLAGWQMTQRWIVWSFILLGIATLRWLPLVWLQIRLRDLSAEADARAEALPARYDRYLRVWLVLGFPGFFALLAVFYLMVAKPI